MKSLRLVAIAAAISAVAGAAFADDAVVKDGYAFVQALVQDNPFATEDYINTLKNTNDNCIAYLLFSCGVFGRIKRVAGSSSGILGYPGGN